MRDSDALQARAAFDPCHSIALVVEAAAGHGLLTLLVVEDEFALLEVLTVALAGDGHRVLKAGDGADALRVLAHHRCDVVICDENMPVINGHQLIAVIRAEPRLAHLPIILMAETWGRDLPLLDDVFVIGKPIYLAELFQRIEAAVTSRRPT